MTDAEFIRALKVNNELGIRQLSDKNDRLEQIAKWLDDRDGLYSPRNSMFRDHSCYRCESGAKPCVVSNPRQCEYPRARND
jgi:hypothetical protein